MKPIYSRKISYIMRVGRIKNINEYDKEKSGKIIFEKIDHGNKKIYKFLKEKLSFIVFFFII